MSKRLIRIMLIPPLLIAVTALVIIGLFDFNFLVRIIAKIIVIIVVLGIPLIFAGRLLTHK